MSTSSNKWVPGFFRTPDFGNVAGQSDKVHQVNDWQSGAESAPKQRSLVVELLSGLAVIGALLAVAAVGSWALSKLTWPGF